MNLSPLMEFSTLFSGISWDWNKQDQIPNSVHQVTCDRDEDINSCVDLLDLVGGYESIRAVIDFSGYEQRPVVDALQFLGPKLKQYIYISTDSVYEVSKPKEHEGPILETDAVRDSSISEEDEHFDYYGSSKLECEEIIQKMFAEEDYLKNKKYFILRLPDVIGPRDTTSRWWSFQLITQALIVRNLPIYTGEIKPMSLVYVTDVGKLIRQLVQKGISSKVPSGAYNLAFESTLTLTELVEKLHAVLLANGAIETGFVPQIYQGKDTLDMYPSVTRGPLDVSKAVKELGWHPTSIEEAIQETARFYIENMQSPLFKTEREDVFIQIQESMHQSETYSVEEWNEVAEHIEVHLLNLEIQPEDFENSEFSSDYSERDEEDMEEEHYARDEMK